MAKKKILVVEDEGVVAMNLQKMLERLGYVVSDVATSGKEAIKKISELLPDLVLMDIMLEENMDGVEAAEQVQCRFNIPVVYLTAYSDEKTLERAKITEPYGYILKPFNERELHSTIEIALYKYEMETKLKEKEQWLSTTLKSIGDAVITTDTKGSVTFMNTIAETLTGWECEKAFGKDLKEVFNIINEKTEVFPENPVSKVLEEGIIVGIGNHSMLISKDGKSTPIDDSAAPIIDDKGEIQGVVLVFRDITERKRAREALEVSEARFRSVIENSQSGILIIDDAYKIVYINNEITKIFGYSREEIVNHDFREFFEGESKDLAAHQYDQSQKGENVPTGYELELIRKGGEKRIVEVSYSNIKDGTGKVQTVVQVLDITGRKGLEEQLRQAQKMRAIGTLAGGVAHDFNNILTAIRGNTELVLNKIDNKNPVYDELIEIHDSANVAANLTRQLLYFSRKQPMKFEFLNINHTIDTMFEMLNRLIGEDIEIVTDLGQDIWTVCADQGTLGQMVLNLVVNARDAMPSGGKLTIKTENIYLEEKYCKSRPKTRPGGFVCFSVADTGIGMDHDTVQRIFDPFFSTKGLNKGTGLGLSVVYGIVEQHKGWIDVDSEPGRGTTFSIYLPSVPNEPSEKKHDEYSTEDLQGQGERILMVEDEKRVRDFTSRALTRCGYNVTEASDAEQALDLFVKEKGDFHLVISDVVLPGKDGLKLVEELISIKSELQIILCSGYADGKSKLSTIQERGFCFLQKPYTLSDLLLNIKMVLTMFPHNA